MFRKTLFARYLTLLILALLSTNLAWGEEFIKVSSTDDLVAGSKYIIVSGSTFAATTTMNGTKGVALGEVKKINDVVTSADNTAIFTLEGNNDSWKLKTGTNYLSANGTVNGSRFVSSTDEESTFIISFVSQSGSLNLVTTTDSKRCLRANSTTDIRFYSGETTTSGVVVYLYKKQADVPVTGVTLNKNTLSLNVGATETLTATIAPDDATNKKVTWSSDKESVATVNESGVVTAVAAGTATITVTTEDGNKTATCDVTVNLNKLATPTNLQAQNVASTSATLTWDAVANASSYEVTLNSEVKTAETNSLLVEGLTASTEYTWTVKAIGDNTTYEDSEESEESNFTTLAPPSVAYTVTFDGNNHGTPASESITEAGAGAGITLPGCTPSEGYQFVGWATTSDATDADAGEAGATYYPTANITLYAVYDKVFTITWSVNGTPTTDGNPTTSVVEGEGITTLPTEPASISGMSFQGWTATQIAESSATAPTDLFTDAEHAPAITANTTFYAVFAEESEGDVTWNNVTTLAGITEGEYVIINGGFYLPSTTTSSSPTTVAAPTILNKTIADENVTAAMKWSFTISENAVIIKNASANYLYTTSSNSGVRVGNTSATWTFTLKNNGYFSMKCSTGRFCAVAPGYNDWRSYTTDNADNYNGNGEKIELYKKTQEITYTYYTNVVVKQLTSISLSGDYPTEFWKGETFNHDGITVTAHYENAEDEDVTEKAEFTGYNMSTVGEQEVTVTYDTKEAKYNITVKTIANTQETAYTVTEAKAIIDANPAELATQEVFVKGTVSQVDKIESGAITYWISEDGTTTNQFEVYKGKNFDNTNFASKDDVKVDDEVVIYGKIKDYKGTYEFDEGNYLVSHVKASTLSIKDITVSLGKEISPEIITNVPEAGRTITYSVTSENVVKVDEEGKLVTVAVGGPVTVTATLTAEGYKDATTTFTVEVIKALTSIEVKTAPTTSYKAGDKFDPTGLVITANYNDETTEDIAYSDETKDGFTFEPSLETALTTENTSVTITYAGKEATQAITVRALYTYDITWMADCEEFVTTQVTEGDALTLPTTEPETINDFVFMGWINSENYFNETTAPEYINPAEIIPKEAMTFYAVYAKKTSKTEEKDVTYTFTSKNWADATSSWTSGKDGNSYQSNLGVQVTTGVTGANATSNSEFTEVSKVVVNYCTNSSKGAGTISVKVGDGTAKSYSVSAPSSGGTTLRNTDDMIFDSETGKVNITVECGTNSIYINSITITSKVSEETYTNYRTFVTQVPVTINDFGESEGNASFCSTFDLDFTGMDAEGVENKIGAYIGQNYVKGETATLNLVGIDKVPAKTGIFVIGTPGTHLVPIYTGEKELEPRTDNSLDGTTAEFPVETAGIYALSNKDGLLHPVSVGVTIGAGKAYYRLPEDASSVSVLTLAIIDEPTGINSINENVNDNKSTAVYNLQGIRVITPKKGEIYIMNGKKFLMK